MSYAKISAQQSNSKQKSLTFDQVFKEYESMRLASFIKFCKDFGIPISLKS